MADQTWPVTYGATAALAAIVPVFPLSGAVFFPRTNLPLNIFEPRYLTMIDDAMRGHRLIGMIQPSGGSEARPRLYGVGCVGRIMQYGETDDGRMVVSVRGLCRFRVDEELTAMTSYRQIRADYSPFGADLDTIDMAEAEARFDRSGYLATLRQYLKVISVEIDWDWVEKAPVEVLINAFAMLAPLSPEEKQALLEARTLDERTAGALTLMELAVAQARSTGFTGPSGASIN